MPASAGAGNGHVVPAEVGKALDCLTRATGCGGCTPHGSWPALGGLMAWSVTWDRLHHDEFAATFAAYFG
ncbi:hypothetical protein [Streptomyces sp. NPDC058045]|uniref:hypothetical protein n=1 Tax=Streptomyces sp. NPDC058045 TaxID=3346311 RepID=UPI0036E425B4